MAGVAGTAASQTGCGPAATPWNEDFDSYGNGATLMPACWAASHNYDLGPRPHLDTTQHHSGTTSLMLYSGTLSGSHYSMAIGPEADVDLTEDYYIRFQYYAATTAVALEVGVCDDTGRYTRHFVPLDTLHAAQGGRWQEVMVDLAAYSGTGRRVAFRLQRALQVEASSCYIDDLRLEGCGTSAPTVTHLGHNSLTVSWERYGSGAIRLEYNGTVVADAVSPLTLTGLQPLTEYTIGVGCAGGTMQQTTVSTLAGAGLTAAYYEPFASGTLPEGWLAPTACQPIVEQGSLTLGDSCLAVLPLTAEDNPFLGLRGIRFSMLHQDVFIPQLQGALDAAGSVRELHPEWFEEGSPLHLIIPMVSKAEEILQVRALLSSLDSDYGRLLELGIMIETPAAVLDASALAAESDFFSVGTNDLTQYIMAADRGNASVGYLYDSFAPPVRRALELTVRAAHDAKIPVGICGEMASDPRATGILIDLGFDSLSLSRLEAIQ